MSIENISKSWSPSFNLSSLHATFARLPIYKKGTLQSFNINKNGNYATRLPVLFKAFAFFFISALDKLKYIKATLGILEKKYI